MQNQRTPVHDFIIKQGATFKKRIRLKINGVTQSLTGFVVQLFFLPDNSSSETILSSTDPLSDDQYLIINTTDPDDNFIEIMFSEDVTDIIVWKFSTYRLDFTDSNDEIKRKLKGRFILEPKS